MNALSSDLNFEAQRAKQKIPKLQDSNTAIGLIFKKKKKKTFFLHGDGVDGLDDITHNDDRGSSNKV